MDILEDVPSVADDGAVAASAGVDADGEQQGPDAADTGGGRATAASATIAPPKKSRKVTESRIGTPTNRGQRRSARISPRGKTGETFRPVIVFDVAAMFV